MKAIKESSRKLEAEREESLSRLVEIEKRLSKNQQTSKLWDSSDHSSDNDEPNNKDIASRNRLYASTALPTKQKRSVMEQERMSEADDRRTDDKVCYN